MRKIIVIPLVIVVIIIGIVLALFLSKGGEVSVEGKIPLVDIVKGTKTSITISSPGFNNLSYIPKRYTCDGEDISPPLKIYNIPKEAKSLVLILYDPDAPKGIFYHWIVYNIPPTVKEIDEGIGIRNKYEIPIGVQALNDFGYIGYGGPCPPPGHKAHRYVFLIIAIDKELNIPPEASIDQILNACKDHVIAYGTYVGLYGR